MRSRIKHPEVSSSQIHKRVEVKSIEKPIKRVFKDVDLTIPKQREFYNSENQLCFRII